MAQYLVKQETTLYHTIKTQGRHGGQVTHILELGTIQRRMVSFMPGETAPGTHTGLEAGWTPQPVLMWWQMETILCLVLTNPCPFSHLHKSSQKAS